MAITWEKLLALLIAAGYIVAAIVHAPSVAMIVVAAAVALAPVALIWFPEYFGGSSIQRKKTVLYTYDEPTPKQRPWRDSHPAMVRMMGWFFLIGLPPLVYWITTW